MVMGGVSERTLLLRMLVDSEAGRAQLAAYNQTGQQVVQTHGAVTESTHHVTSSFGSLRAEAMEARGVVAGLGLDSQVSSVGMGLLSAASLSTTAAMTATGIAVVGATSFIVAQGSALENNEAQLQAWGHMGITQAQLVGEAFVAQAGQTTMSAQEEVGALASVIPQLQLINQGQLTVTQSTLFMASATDLAEASGQKLTETTAALASIQVTFGHSAAQAAEDANSLQAISELTGVGMEQLAMVVGRLHDRFGPLAPDLQGTGVLLVQLEMAGVTGQRGIMVVSSAIDHLLARGKESKEELDRLKVSLFETDGSAKPLETTLTSLAKAEAVMSDQERLAANNALFGAAGAAALDTVLKNYLQTLPQATDQIRKQSDAHEQATIRVETFSGELGKLKAAVQSVAGGIGDSIVGVETYDQRITRLSITAEHSTQIQAALASGASTMAIQVDGATISVTREAVAHDGLADAISHAIVAHDREVTAAQNAIVTGGKLALTMHDEAVETDSATAAAKRHADQLSRTYEYKPGLTGIPGLAGGPPLYGGEEIGGYVVGGASAKPGEALSGSQVARILVEAGFSGQGLLHALEVTFGESGWHPGITSPEDYDARTGAYLGHGQGLFQFQSMGNAPSAAINRGELNPYNAAEAALAAFRVTGGGNRPEDWTGHGWYGTRFLGAPSPEIMAAYQSATTPGGGGGTSAVDAAGRATVSLAEVTRTSTESITRDLLKLNEIYGYSGQKITQVMGVDEVRAWQDALAGAQQGAYAQIPIIEDLDAKIAGATEQLTTVMAPGARKALEDQVGVWKQLREAAQQTFDDNITGAGKANTALKANETVLASNTAEVKKLHTEWATAEKAVEAANLAIKRASPYADQIDQLNVLKAEHAALLIPMQQELRSLQDQDTVLGDMISLTMDQASASPSALNITSAQRGLTVDRDRLEIQRLILVQQGQSTVTIDRQLTGITNAMAINTANLALIRDTATLSSSDLLNQQTKGKVLIDQQSLLIAQKNKIDDQNGGINSQIGLLQGALGVQQAQWKVDDDRVGVIKRQNDALLAGYNLEVATYNIWAQGQGLPQMQGRSTLPGTINLLPVPGHGSGGIVMSPEVALVGEVPEAIIPLSQLGRGGPGTTVVNININAPVYGVNDINRVMENALYQAGLTNVRFR